jgi:hypothetical protein
MGGLVLPPVRGAVGLAVGLVPVLRRRLAVSGFLGRKTPEPPPRSPTSCARTLLVAPGMAARSKSTNAPVTAREKWGMFIAVLSR